MLTFKNLKMCFRKIPLSQIQTQNYSKFVSTNKGNFNQILTNRKRSSGVDLSYYDMLNQTNWLNGTSIVYFENLYEEWKKEPNSVSKEWNTYFKNMEAEEDFEISNKNKPILENGMINSRIGDHLTVQGIIRSFQIRGHLKSRLDPLDMPYRLNTEIAEDIKNLSIESFNLGNSDLDKVFKLPETTFIGGANEKELPLREIIKRLEDSYCKSIGVEYSYLSDRDSLQWIRRKFETPNIRTMSNVEKKVLLNRLIRSTNFEEYLAKKWSSEKRFGLEGCEVLIPAIKTIVDVCSEQGLEKYIFGMPHRGRLNVIANVLGKPLEQIFAQFDVSHGDTSDNSGDVKYHLGLHNEIVNKFSGKDISMSLVANPSHLEAVGPVVLGKVKADQFYNNDTDGSKTMGIILHGDAAFSGQGVVYETLHLSDLNMYKTHGVIHIVVNNQIGFTTDPRDARSSIYCTDVAKVINAPILHVNADDPEAVMHVSKVAAEWRMKKKRDIVIDLVCYRRNGHNETDEPQFTQPCMYQKIRNLPKLLKQYSTKLLNENVITLEEYQKQIEGYQKQLDAGHDAAKNAPHIHTNRDWLDSPWNNFFDNQDPMKIKETGISLDTLHKIGNVFNDIPKSKVNYYKGLLRILNNRKKMMDIETFDWAMCEAFAFGSLLLDKVHVRLSGQDVERGTFSHRHHVIMDQDNLGKKYVPLDNISLDQEKYTVCNSSLSEFAVMGFELGFSMHNPNSLIIWEAQFGDFVNNAQCIIDQFLSSGQAKWIRQCGLVLLLPHGMEGMGPEHSYARLSRFLQMCNDDSDVHPLFNQDFHMQQMHEINWIVAAPSTPANMFHLIRRQMALPFRKPLIVMTPKSLLRHPDVRSSFKDIITGTEFQRIIPETGVSTHQPFNVKKLIFCTSKVYYDLFKERNNSELNEEIAICRVEQISPFPYDMIKKEIELFPFAKIEWVQEEHKNMGAWSYIQPRFNTLLSELNTTSSSNKTIGYIGRSSAAATATGNKAKHFIELNQLLQYAMKTV